MTDQQRLLNHISTFLLIGGCVGTIAKFLDSLNTREQQRIEAINRELEQERQAVSTVFTSNPHINVLFDDQFGVIDCNDAAIEFMGFDSRATFFEGFLERLVGAIPEVMPDGSKPMTLRGRLTDAVTQGQTVFETTLVLEDCAHTMQFTLKRIPFRGSFVIIVYGVELTEAYRMRNDLLQRDKLLAVINGAAEQLLTSDSSRLQEVLDASMGTLAQTLDIDRMYIWKNEPDETGLRYVPEYGWISSTTKKTTTVHENSGFSYIDSLPHWEDIFSRNEVINGPLKTLGGLEQQTLAPFGIQSILVIPVIMQEQFWGFVSFDDLHKDYTFSDEEVHILRSWSLMIASTVERKNADELLNRALDDALQASQAKGNFLSNMSHEMRTPMNAIIGMTSIGKQARDLQRKDDAFQKIEDASSHLLGVINDVLDISKIEANKLELNTISFNFEKMLQKVVNVVNFRVEENGQRFFVAIDHLIPPYLIGDDQRLEQVITNLLSNAVKFTPEGGTIRLDTKLLEQQDDICTISIEVTDTGIGISAEQKERLFRSFEQADSGTSRKFGGTGLGLAISKRIVDLMGGEVWIESELGEGSTFGFYVRLECDEEAPRQPDLHIDWSTVRILAVDDQSETRLFFRQFAEHSGLNCDTAASGQSALDAIEQNGQYDIYFIDWNMPDINGIELARRIRAGGGTRSIITIISGTDWTDIEEEASEVGVDRYLAKPLFPSDISDLINTCIGGDRNFVRATSPTHDLASNDFSGHRILIAEDIKVNQEIILALLEPTRLEIDIAENGVEVLEKLREDPQRYEMIFMDVQMPEMDGLEATRQIRSLNDRQAQNIPIVAMTANVFREDVEKCLAAGMNDHVGKPINLDEVLEKLRTYLS
ncbi:MAG: response regulator [Coriobacteriales bacterium]|jgi:signal transduction histidine kinase/CheY-like chemotaxis protein|nr:response regulator [Coriobacteriales bacterium]